MKLSSLLVVLVLGLIITSCASAKKTAEKAAAKADLEKREAIAKITYTKDIKPVLLGSCTPCHYPPDGKKLALDTYASVKTNIQDIISRCAMAPDQKGYMPFMSKKPALTAAQLQTLKDWASTSTMPE